jgi:ABC-2 type transport system permease protein
VSWAIETHALCKQFPKQQGWRELFARKRLSPPVIDQVDLTVRQGELFGLLGPNGAGKTTLIKILCTLIVPTSGTAQINGCDLSQEETIRRSTGLVTSDERSFFWRLSARQNLAFFAALHGLDGELAAGRIETILRQVGLSEYASIRFQTFSTGMRQRMAIARALLHQPNLLFMDEPSKGLDPNARRQLQQLIQTLREQNGITIFLTTHDLQEAEALCERIAIMHHGRILDCGAMPELRERLDLRDVYTIKVEHLLPATQAKLMGWAGTRRRLEIVSDNAGSERAKSSAQIQFQSQEGSPALNQTIDILREDNIHITSIAHQPATLEQVFVRMIEQGEQSSRQLSPESKQDTPVVGRSLTIRNQRASSLAQTLHITMAFLRRDYLSEASYRVSFIMQFIGIFMSIGIYYFIAQLIGQTPVPELEVYGGDYFSFVLIGVAFSGYFGTGLTSFAQSLRQAQSSGTMEAMLATPINLSTMILSSSLWQYLMTTIRVLVYLLLGSLLVTEELVNANYPAALLVLVLSILVFSSLGILAASFIMVIKRGDPVTWIFSTLNGLLGGVYFPVSMFPEWLQWISALLPTTYALHAMRLALLQGAQASELWLDLLALCLFCLVLTPLSLLAFRYAVRQAKIDGSLTHY